MIANDPTSIEKNNLSASCAILRQVDLCSSRGAFFHLLSSFLRLTDMKFIHIFMIDLMPKQSNVNTDTFAARRILEPQLLHHHGSRSGRSDLQNGWAKDGHYVCVCVCGPRFHSLPRPKTRTLVTSCHFLPALLRIVEALVVLSVQRQ